MAEIEVWLLTGCTSPEQVRGPTSGSDEAQKCQGFWRYRMARPKLGILAVKYKSGALASSGRFRTVVDRMSGQWPHFDTETYPTESPTISLQLDLMDSTSALLVLVGEVSAADLATRSSIRA